MDRWLDWWVIEQDRPLVCAGKFKGVLLTERGKTFYPKHILSLKWTQSLRNKWENRDYLWVPSFPPPLLPVSVSLSLMHTRARTHTHPLFFSLSLPVSPSPTDAWVVQPPGCRSWRTLSLCPWAFCRLERGKQGLGENVSDTDKNPKWSKRAGFFERKDLFLDLSGRGCVLKIII